mgnify:CR=1 FL=1
MTWWYVNRAAGLVAWVLLSASIVMGLLLSSKALGKRVTELTAVVLDRPRHAELIAEIRAAGAKVRLIMDGDVAGGVAAASDESSVDMLMGVGGTPEGIITACAMKCMGGEIQGQLWPQDEAERQKAVDAGLDVDAILGTDDLVKGDNCFFAATGITNGDMVRGVSYRANGAITRSLVMRSKSGTVISPRSTWGTRWRFDPATTIGPAGSWSIRMGSS